jgi:nitroreductase
MNITDALLSRSSKRAFQDRPVPQSAVEDLLHHARYAPSGSNIQPWHVYAVAGEVRDRIVREAIDTAINRRDQLSYEYHYYPQEWREPYLARRRACGWGLYSTLGIAKGDRMATARQELRNFEFFGAPVGLFFFIDRDMEPGSWLDYGMFIQSIMLMARERGLDTCPQAAWVPFHSIVQAAVGAPPPQMLVCGMALGYADPAQPVNAFRPERLAVAEFTRYLGFGDAG